MLVNGFCRGPAADKVRTLADLLGWNAMMDASASRHATTHVK
jgi:hypothetical protein